MVTNQKTKKRGEVTIIIRQQPLFTFEELMELKGKTKLELILDQIDVTSLSEKMKHRSKRGPRGYNPTPIIYALIAQQIEQIPTRAALVKRLQEDPSFRYSCGFKVIGDVPSEATFCRYYEKLTEDESLENIYLQMLQDALSIGLIDGKSVSIDATNLSAYERAKPKKQIPAKQIDIPNWGSKQDSNGNQKAWYGWKLHLSVDSKSELPLMFELSQASKHDCDYALPIIDNNHHWFLIEGKAPPSYWVMDMGYDAQVIYEDVRSVYGGQAIIPINKRNAKEPPAGYYDFKGTPACSAGYAMVFWGCDGKSNKFRCPHVLGKVDCPFGSNWCSSSNYGNVVKTRVSKDPRYISFPHRGSETWQKLYNERTSVERCFSGLKENLNLDKIMVAGKKKVTTHVLLCLIALVGAKLAVEAVNRQEIAA